MRKPKKNNTELVHRIERTWKATDRGQAIGTGEQLETIAAICGTLHYLEIYDVQRGENHKEYFIKRHLSLHNNMSQLQIADNYGICKDTVSSYCLMYIKIFEKCLWQAHALLNEKEKINGELFTRLIRTMVQNRK